MTKAKRLTDEDGKFIDEVVRLGQWQDNLKRHELRLKERDQYLSQWFSGLSARQKRMEEWHKHLEQRELRLKEREVDLERQLLYQRDKSLQAQRDTQAARSVNDFNLGVFLFNIIMWGVFFGAAWFIGHHVVGFLQQVF